NTAQKMGVKEFIPRVRYLVRDDHLPLNKIAKIPVCDLIDFEYPDPRNRFWHTTADTPARCSADSLEKVGRVIQTWLKTKR
ncbi:MAG TPA: peptidase M28, partial [Planctomycetaceae bacterium]|nr:peptidase M28 [Planctomycetaceae bacterium]